MGFHSPYADAQAVRNLAPGAPLADFHKDFHLSCRQGLEPLPDPVSLGGRRWILRRWIVERADGIDQASKAFRFFKEVARAGLHGANGQRHIGMGCNNNHRDLRSMRTEGLCQSHAVHGRHSHVGYDAPDRIGRQARQKVTRRAKGFYGKLRRRKMGSDDVAHQRVVINNIDLPPASRVRHPLTLSGFWGSAPRPATSLRLGLRPAERADTANCWMSLSVQLPSNNRQLCEGVYRRSSEIGGHRLREQSMSTILTLDDDILFCEFIHDVLAQDGHSVVTAYNGEEGLGMLARQTFDLVLTDIDMPIMDGLEFLRRARAMPCGIELPFILLTGRRREQVMVAENAIEGVPFLQKPVMPGTISKTVRATLDDFARAREGLGGHRGGILQ